MEMKATLPFGECAVGDVFFSKGIRSPQVKVHPTISRDKEGVEHIHNHKQIVSRIGHNSRVTRQEFDDEVMIAYAKKNMK